MSKITNMRSCLLAGVSAAAIGLGGAAMAQITPDTSAPPMAPASTGANPSTTPPPPTQQQRSTIPSSQGSNALPVQNGSQVQEVVVTAQKRSQNINNVGMSITAISGNALVQQGVTSTADLAKIVPGLTFEPSPFNTPVYTLRGVGFYDSTLSASPTVAVYTDEAPLPFSAMTKAAGLDLERVEVLKGPQGTLYGENTTGGAINYIAAKPTSTYQAGLDASYGRFDTTDVQGYLSGPLTNNLNARLSARTVQSGPWQESYTHDAQLGDQNLSEARLLLDWRPLSKLSVSVNLNGWLDKSDTQAPQLEAFDLNVPANTVEADKTLAYPLAPHNARAADWENDLGIPRQTDSFYEAVVRADYKINNEITATSITAYENYRSRALQDFDGTTENIADSPTDGHIDTYYQELRLSGVEKGFNWIVGANYEADNTYDRLGYFFADSTTSVVGPYHFYDTYNFSHQNVRSAAVYANAEYEVLQNLTLLAGVRYTNNIRDFKGCTNDTGDDTLSPGFTFIESELKGGPVPAIPAGGCVTFDPTFTPYNGSDNEKLSQDNISWHVGANYKVHRDGLFDNALAYVSVSKGYKSGAFPTASSSSYTQYLPVGQESLLAYEVGMKTPLFDRRVQFNVAGFYYDYSDKQLEGREIDPVFGPLDTLVTIPKSHVAGAEAQLIWLPINGLTINLATTYLDTQVDDFIGYNNAAEFTNFKGSAFPYAPKWQVVADVEYDHDLTDQFGGFIGGSLNYNSATTAALGNDPRSAIDDHEVLDLRGGLKTLDGKYRLTFYGRNVTNQYYWTQALQSEDVFVRYAAMPVTYGVILSARFH